jgi:hypothetical protein
MKRVEEHRLRGTGTEQKPVSRLRHVGDTTKGKAVKFKLPPWLRAI